jgi:hypothetical protein
MKTHARLRFPLTSLVSVTLVSGVARRTRAGLAEQPPVPEPGGGGAGPLPVLCARTGLTSSQTVGVGMPRSTSEARREASRAK